MIFLVLISFYFKQCVTVTDTRFLRATHFFSSDSSHALIYCKGKHTDLCNKDTDPTLGTSVAKTLLIRVINCLPFGKFRHFKTYFHPKWIKNIETPKCLVKCGLHCLLI